MCRQKTPESPNYGSPEQEGTARGEGAQEHGEPQTRTEVGGKYSLREDGKSRWAMTGEVIHRKEPPRVLMDMMPNHRSWAQTLTKVWVEEENPQWWDTSGRKRTKGDQELIGGRTRTPALGKTEMEENPPWRKQTLKGFTRLSKGQLWQMARTPTGYKKMQSEGVNGGSRVDVVLLT